MKRLIQTARLSAAALLLALVITAAARSPERTGARSPSGVLWNISVENYNNQSNRTVDNSSRSEQHSYNGQDSTYVQVQHINLGGVSHQHEEFYYADSKGNGSYSNGKPWKGSSKTDLDTDSKGDRKEHHEEIIEKDGSCEKYIRDDAYDKNNTLLSHTESKSTIPCSEYSLQVSMNGTISYSGLKVMYGPNRAMIDLESEKDAYQGSYEGVFDVSVKGKCDRFDTFPINIDAATPKEDQFRYLDFSVKISIGNSFAALCLPAPPPIKIPPVTDTLTFTLPAQDGATKIYRMSGGGAGKLALTFTLKKQ